MIWTIAGLLALLQVSIILSRTAGGGPSPDIPPALVVASWYSLWVPIVLVALGVFMNDQHRMLRDLGARGGGSQG